MEYGSYNLFQENNSNFSSFILIFSSKISLVFSILVVSIFNSDDFGSSKGSSIPVKPFKTPALAFAYKPFTSLLSHSSRGVET